MDVEKYVDKAREEILNPEFAVTKQYLEVNEVEYENGLPKVERVDLDYSDDLVAVYFRFKKERYFLEIHLNKEPEIAVNFVWIESGHRTYFAVKSGDLSFKELTQNLKLKPLTGWSKGDLRKDGKSEHNFSLLSFEPFSSEAYALDRQIKILLTELEKDAGGVRLITEKAIAYISVCKHQYVSGNAGLHLDIETINRLSRLNLSLDIDTYIVGNALKEGVDE